MAKLITRDNWRVTVTGTLDLTVPGGPRIEVEVKDAVIEPQRLGDFGSLRMPDSMVSSDTASDYERRCKEIARAVTDRFPGIRATVAYDTTETCSHCGLGWDEWTTESSEQWPNEDYVVGEPLCCDEAQAEWRAAKGVAA